MNLSHEFNDEAFDLAKEIKSLRDFESEEEHNARYELMHRFAPEGYDFYAQYEYMDEE